MRRGDALWTSYAQFGEMLEKHNEVHVSFMKHIILVASTLFGVLVALHKTPIGDYLARLLYALAVSGLSLGILFLTIALFEHVALHRSLVNQKRADIQLHLKDDSHTPKILSANSSKIYKTAEVIAYSSFTISILALTAYAIKVA